MISKKSKYNFKAKKYSISVTSVVICLHIVIFVIDEIQKGALVCCALMKEILNKYSDKEADCITIFPQAVNIQ